jgi:protein O-mannosyl-transferase
VASAVLNSSATQVPRRSGFWNSPQTRSAVAGVLLAIATFGLYYPVTSHPFSNDDDGAYVVYNFHIKYGLDSETVKWAFSTFYLGNWHPLTWLSHALDCQLFYLNAGRHHAVNALLHACNALLLFWVLWRATGFPGRSLMVAALFALHPINVESVAWLSERKNVLSMFFFLLALGAYTWYARKPRPDRYAGVAVLYACALLSKPQVISFPCVLLLWDYWPLQRMFSTSGPGVAENTRAKGLGWLLLEKLPLFALSAVSAVITVKAQRAGGAMTGAFNTFPFSARLGNAIVSYVSYLRNTIWPSRLAFMYPHPGTSLPIWRVVAASVLLLAISMIVVLKSQKRYLPAGWLWFLGTLVPMIGLVQVGPQAMADRYAYLPLIGLFIMFSWAVTDWARRRHIPAAALVGASLGILMLLSVVTRRQIGYWKDDVSLWSHAVQVTPPNYIAEDNLGLMLLTQGQPEASIGHIRAALAIAPSYPPPHLYLGYYEEQRGNLPQAIEQYQQVITLTQNEIAQYAMLRDQALMNMGNVYRTLGDSAKAYECFAAVERQRREYAHEQ